MNTENNALITQICIQDVDELVENFCFPWDTQEKTQAKWKRYFEEHQKNEMYQNVQGKLDSFLNRRKMAWYHSIGMHHLYFLTVLNLISFRMLRAQVKRYPFRRMGGDGFNDPMHDCRLSLIMAWNLLCDKYFSHVYSLNWDPILTMIVFTFMSCQHDSNFSFVLSQ